MDGRVLATTRQDAPGAEVLRFHDPVATGRWRLELDLQHATIDGVMRCQGDAGGEKGVHALPFATDAMILSTSRVIRTGVISNG